MVGAAALLLAALLSTPGPFVLANNAGGPLTELAIRPADGSGDWRPLGPGALPAAGRSAMPSPGGQLCAFDIRGRLAGSLATWTSVNLCDVKTVTLNRRADNILWVDYD